LIELQDDFASNGMMKTPPDTTTHVVNEITINEKFTSTSDLINRLVSELGACQSRRTRFITSDHRQRSVIGIKRTDITALAEAKRAALGPKGRAHMVISLEPIEAVRVLSEYGNPDVKVIANMRPVHPIGVICGNHSYPGQDNIAQWLDDLSEKVWLMNTTQEAARLGNPIYSNVIMVGALSATNELPVTAEAFETVIRQRMPADKVDLNLEAFEIGRRMVA
jgi:indolepyruvate ferredoxin oxidoreductase beta subunit